MSGLVQEARRFREELSKSKGDKYRLTAENKVVLALGTEILALKTTTCSGVSSFQEVKTRAVETERGLKKSQETVAVSDSQQKSLTDKVSSLTKELSSIRVECVNVRVDLDEITALV